MCFSLYEFDILVLDHLIPALNQLRVVVHKHTTIENKIIDIIFPVLKLVINIISLFAVREGVALRGTQRIFLF